MQTRYDSGKLILWRRNFGETTVARDRIDITEVDELRNELSYEGLKFYEVSACCNDDGNLLNLPGKWDCISW